MHVQRYWPWFQSRYKCVTRGEEGGGFNCPFPEIGKKFPNFEGKCPDCGHLWYNFSIQVQFLKASRRKNWRFIPVGPLFLVFQIEVSLFQENSPALKGSWLRACIISHQWRYCSTLQLSLFDCSKPCCSGNLANSRLLSMKLKFISNNSKLNIK